MSCVNKKYLIINGDDFGLNQWVNEGIVDAYKSGMLHSASLFVNAESTENAVSLSLNSPGLELGLHVNCTEGKCISNQEKLPNLVDINGYFILGRFHPSQFKGFLSEKIISQPSILHEMRLEIQAQIQRFKSFGLKLSHINFHHYLNLFDDEILKIQIELAEENFVPFRGISQPIINKINLTEEMIQRMKIMCQEAKVPSPSTSISNLSEFDSYPTLNYPAQMTQRIQELYLPDSTESIEIIVHPVREIKDKSIRDSYYIVRNQETLFFQNDVFGKKMESLGYVFSGYSSLWENFRLNAE